jgi:hypothetical protein
MEVKSFAKIYNPRILIELKIIKNITDDIAKPSVEESRLETNFAPINPSKNAGKEMPTILPSKKSSNK